MTKFSTGTALSKSNYTANLGHGTKHQQDRELQDNELDAVSGGTLRGISTNISNTSPYDRKGGRYLGQMP
jgi:hypothetical protein